MNVKIYYRGFNRKLHQINDVVGDGETISEVIFETRVYLQEERAMFSEPLLALIQGGKA